jgi:Spy/CpxP family protein refolding chaperone
VVFRAIGDHMMSLKQIVFAAALVIGSGASAAADPAGGWHHGPMGHEHHGYMDLLRGVNLTDEQKSQIHAMAHQGWGEMKSNFQQMHAVHEQITTLLLGSGTVTEDQLAPLLRQEDQLRAQEEKTRMAEVLAIRNMLTPEQLAQAASVHAQMEALHQQEKALMPSEAH